jgi:hypothetical protein
VIDPADYARQVESYLCQKNHGHLIRVVGPAFDLVSRWAASGVPLKVAFRGIDRCCERRLAKGGPRRRPIRIEFCEADVGEAFDEWRRAVGVATPSGGAAGNGEGPARKPSLESHIERAIARLAHARGRHGLIDASGTTDAFDRHLDRVIRELEEVAATARSTRGHARAELLATLGRIDVELLETAIGALDGERTARLRAEAGQELAPFGARMPADARERALSSAFQRLVREACGLPTLVHE